MVYFTFFNSNQVPIFIIVTNCIEPSFFCRIWSKFGKFYGIVISFDVKNIISVHWWIDRIFQNYINNFPLKRLKIGFIIIRTPTCVLMIRTIPNFITVYNILTETISNKSIRDNTFMHIHVFQGSADKKPVSLFFWALSKIKYA